MKTNKSAIAAQRRMMDKKLEIWREVRNSSPPPLGWLKAIRDALGITSRQLAQIIGVDMSAVLRLEEREPEGKATLEMLNRAALAMDCKVVYAIVPRDDFASLEAIIDHRSQKAAKELLQNVEHSMRLERQGSPESKSELQRLIHTMKEKMDPRIWGIQRPSKKKKER